MNAAKYKTHNSSTVVAEKSLGTRTIMNSNFGRIATVRREQWSGHVEWTVAIVCNGISDYSQTFRTRREALADYEAI